MRWLLVLSFLMAASLGAETVVLKNGTRLSGRILEQDDRQVKLELTLEGGGVAVLTIARARIDRIEQATTFEDRLKAADDLLSRGFKADAERAFRELVRERPKDARARMGLARALMVQDSAAEAAKTLEHYLVLVPQGRDANLVLLLAEVYLALSEFKAARDAAREAQALEPLNQGLRQAVDALLRRIERVRDGTEAEEARDAERRRKQADLARARAEFKRDAGSHADAAEASAELLAWTAETDTGLATALFTRLSVEARAESAYERGGPETDFRGAVAGVMATVTVNEAAWLKLFDHRKRELIYGWYYQLKARYPQATVIVNVEKIEQERGRPKSTTLGRASYDGRKAELLVDLWTAPNIDKDRQARLTRRR